MKIYSEKIIQRPLAVLLCLFIGLTNSIAQPDANYVKTVRMLDSLQSQSITSYQFCDGYGRPTLSATSGAGICGYYTYTLQGYNLAGRISSQCLPIVGDRTVQNMQLDDYYSNSSDFYEDEYGYTTFTYDPLGRPVRTYPPGEAWTDVSRETVYVTNTTTDVSAYPAGSLRGEVVTDEDGHTLTTLYDARGLKMLERRGTNNNTRFLYDTRGLLTTVLMPGHNYADPNHTSYGYEYDARGRVIRKRFPGAAYIQYWYDNADRVAFMQDGMLREKNRYRFMLYDVFGRLAVQGTCSGGGLSAVSSVVPVATFTPGSGGFLSTGYVISNSVTITSPSLEIVNYYDSYDFLSGSMSGMFLPITAQNGICVKGLPTGSVTAVSNGGFVCSINLYDDRGRVVETRSTTLDASLTEVRTTAYTFTDNPQTSEYRLLHSSQGTAFVAHAGNTYYAANDKLHATTLQIGVNNSQPTSSRTVQNITYNDLGQVSSIARPGSTGTVSYQYDLHGWITNITTPSFREELYYATDGGCSGTPCYNGNVSVQKWSNGNYAQKRGYKFTYDALNRLTEGIYGERDALSYHKNYFNEQILAYYQSGAVKRLQRRGMKNDGEHGKVDNLHITVKGNRLHYVEDDAEKLLYDGAFDFHGDQYNHSAYQYNANGSLITDTGKGIMFIAYDDNGMPRRIQFANGNVTEYVYTATGRKLRTIYYTAVPGINVGSGETHQLSAAEILSKDSIDYFGNLIMENGTPKQYLFPGGYCSLNGGIGWHYYNQDHLGNNREVVSESGTLEQVTNYYPFGAPFCEPTTAGVNTNATLQRYKYNGKELDLMHGLKWYDYGARMYDPILLTWNSIDPLCENYYNISPYAYCGNNPVMYIDPTGLDYWSTDDPDVIYEFLNNLKTYGFSNIDYKEWNHTTDADFLANLAYNDQTNKYYYSRGMVENGEVVCYSKTFDPDISSDWSIPFDVANSVYNQADNIRWGSNGQFYYRNPQGNIFHGSQYVSVKSINTPGLRFLAKSNIPVQVAIGGYNIWQGFHNDGKRVGYNTVYQGTTALGGIAGGWTGGKVGAAFGTWVGAHFGGIGAIPGAIIGGIVGSIGGSIGGSAAIGYGVNKYYTK